MDSVSIFDYVVSVSTVINERWIGNELEDIMGYFKIPTLYSPGRPEENREEPVRTVLYPGRDSKWTHPEYKSEMIRTEPTSVACSEIVKWPTDTRHGTYCTDRA
jgi:hypothetical protein